MGPIQLVVFDLAGTTIDDDGGVVLSCLVETVRAHDLPGTPAELNALMGMNKREVFGMLAARRYSSSSTVADELAEEALAISDRIAVMAKGKIEQLDQPEEIYSNPRTVFTATFVGTSNRFNGVLASAAEGLCQVEDQVLHIPSQQDLHNGDQVLVMVRPEEVTISSADDMPAGYGANGSGNHILGVIQLRAFLGPFIRFHVQVNAEMTLIADVPSQQAREFYVAQQVKLSFLPSACQVLPLDAGAKEMEKLSEKV